MLLLLDDEQKSSLRLLSQFDIQVAAELAKRAVEFIKKGVVSKIYQNASQKLGIEAAALQRCIEALMYVLCESCKLSLSEIDFRDSLMILDLPEELRKELLDIYLQNRKEVRAILSESSVHLPEYRDLEWRIDVQLASRALRRQVQPSVLLRLHTSASGQGDSCQLLQTDPGNLLHLTEVLEDALQEARSQHSRRIMRNIK